MSALTPEQEQTHAFLLKHFERGSVFTKEELHTASGWAKMGTFNTHWSKQFEPLLVDSGSGKYRVGEAFRKLADQKAWFKYVSQNRNASNYTSYTHDAVVVFEFFMPLTNEADLRGSLDSLFYQDSIDRRLKFADKAKLQAVFPRNPNEANRAYLVRLRNWVSSKFGGYSINHVSGRFLAAELTTRKDSADNQWSRYLVDETTAVVKFIFPCGEPKQARFGDFSKYLEDLLDETPANVHVEANKIRYFFHLLFVQSIVEAVNGEDQIWLLESGLRSNLHIWRLSDEA